MRRLVIFLSISICLFMVNIGQARGALVMPGPSLTSGPDYHLDAGLQFTALQNVVLESFVFQLHGFQDSISLTNSDGTTVYETYTVPVNSNPSHLVDVSWSLVAGQTYNLISNKAGNGMWDSYSNFPTANAHIRVDGSWADDGSGGHYLSTDLWLHFNDLTTVPIPGAVWLLGSGLIGIVGVRRKFKK